MIPWDSNDTYCSPTNGYLSYSSTNTSSIYSSDIHVNVPHEGEECKKEEVDLELLEYLESLRFLWATLAFHYEQFMRRAVEAPKYTRLVRVRLSLLQRWIC